MITTPHHYLISVYRGGLYFVSVCTSEVMPLFVIEFLHRVVDTFQDYFGDCTETLIKENYVVSVRDCTRVRVPPQGGGQNGASRVQQLLIKSGPGSGILVTRQRQGLG